MRGMDMPEASEVRHRTPNARLRLGLPILAALVAAAVFAGCGVEGQELTGSEAASDSTTATTIDPATATVSTDEIASTDPDSPERAVLEWWRALQSRDTDGVTDSYTKKVKDDLPDGFKFSIVSYLAPLASTAAISVDSVETNAKKSSGSSGGDGGGSGDKSSAAEEADKGTLYATIDSTAPRIAGSLALPMEKEDGEWKIADSTFLVALAGQSSSQAAQESTTTESTTTTGG
ncbi:MAG: hypothetical protein R2700_15615 [Solirubrobacterales bacterium]